MIKTNIKMRVTPEQSAKVQEICFENGINWKDVDNTIQHTDKPYLFISNNKSISYSFYEAVFIEDEFKEIDPELFIRTNGSCIENLYKNNFKDYGFEGNFEGEILKEYEKQFVGMVYQNEGNFGCSWDKKGRCLQAERFGYIDMNLKPIENPDLSTDKDNNKAKNPNSKHYELWENFEAIDVIKLALTDEEYKGFLKGNILKYQLRLGKKDDVSKEIEKIKDYQRELNK